jgi:hypothetical protein
LAALAAYREAVRAENETSGGIFIASMGSLFGLFLALFAGFWLFLAGRGMAREFKKTDRFKWIVAVMYLLILVGASGFFAAALSATGVLKLPTSREWPAGYVSGVVTAADGKYIVPLVPSGRVQLYDSQWHFIRGWNVDAGGGDFKVQYSPDGVIEVFTARGEHHYSFTEDGHLISSTRILPNSLSSLPKGQSVVVPTSPLLWVFSSPFLSWGVMVIGFVGMAILKKIGRRAAV